MTTPAGSGTNYAEKHGPKGGRDRLWSGEYGGGFLGREIVDPNYMAQLLAGAQGQQMSAAEQLMRSGLAQQQAQAYGLAASGAGANPALALRGAQQAASQAGLQAQGQFGAMRADEMARAQALYAQTAFGQQQLNDQAAAQREALLAQLIAVQAGKNQKGSAAGPVMSGAAAGAAAGAPLGPYGALGGAVLGAGTGYLAHRYG